MTRTHLGFVGVFVAGTLCGTWHAAGNNRDVPADAAVRRVVGAIDRIERDAAHRRLTRDELADAAIEGIIMRFDPEGDYVNEEAATSFNQTVTIIRASPPLAARWQRRLVVTRVDIGSDLERQGIRPGDEIVELDGAPVDGLSGNDFLLRFGGPPRTHVRLGIRSQSTSEARRFAIPRFHKGESAHRDSL